MTVRSGGRGNRRPAWERELVASTPLRAEDIAQLKPVFDFFDTDLDARLTVEQCGMAFQQLGFADSSALSVTLTDFPMFCRLIGLAKKRAFDADPLEGKLRLTFRLIAPEGSRDLGSAEFLEAVKAVGVVITSDQADRIAELIYPEDATTFNEDSFVAFVKQQIALS